MFASVTSVAIVGVEPRVVTVEVHIGGGTPAFVIVGLPDAAVREAKERVRAAMVMTEYGFPERRVVVNLSPADLPKAGSAYDLPIALGVIAAAGRIPNEATDVVALGELALDGSLRPVRGGLGAALVAYERGVRCILPPESAAESADRGDLQVVAARSLAQSVAVAMGEDPGAPVEPMNREPAPAHDLAEVRGISNARRALEIAAAGGHHLLLRGAPGAGKTLLASCLPGLLPPLQPEEQREVALAWAAAGLMRTQPELPPFRAPHHSATVAAVVGGGSGLPVPGEASLAHRGVLFLDELGEFPTNLVDALRQPVEEGRVVVARKGAAVSFPCRVQLVAATNPCPCGFRNDRLEACGCTGAAMDRYGRRLSGPLLDRFDLRVEVPRLEPDEMGAPPGEPSTVVRGRVVAARERQFGRSGLNRDLTRGQLDELGWTPRAEDRLRAAVRPFALTGRGWDRIRRVARTIADLEPAEMVSHHHVEEALAHREVA